MVDLKTILAAFLIIGSASAAVNYTTFTAPNVTSIGQAMNYSATVMGNATGNNNAFGLMLIATIFLGFYVVGSKYTQERALVYASFMSVMVSFLLVSGNFLAPEWLILTIIALLASIYFANRVG